MKKRDFIKERRSPARLRHDSFMRTCVGLTILCGAGLAFSLYNLIVGPKIISLYSSIVSITLYLLCCFINRKAFLRDIERIVKSQSTDTQIETEENNA